MSGVTAEQAVIAQQPEVAELGDRLLGRFGGLVGVGEARVGEVQGEVVAPGDVFEQAVQVVVRDAGQQLREFLTVGSGHRRDGVDAGQDDVLVFL